MRSLLALAMLAVACRMRPPLVVAAMHDDLPAVKALLSAGADPNRCSDPNSGMALSPLNAAVAGDNVAMVDALLRAGAAVDRPCGVERPMDIAVAGGHVEIIRRLIDAGADVRAVTAGGWTYLMQAAIHVRPEVMPLLVEKGCPLEAKRPDSGETALMMAAAWDLRVTRPLIAAGADVNARSNKGDTPLLAALKGARFAAENGETKPGHFEAEIVGELLRAGSDPDARNSAGETALSLAAQTGRFRADIERLLRRPTAGQI